MIEDMLNKAHPAQKPSEKNSLPKKSTAKNPKKTG
jgi:hypothetical protein